MADAPSIQVALNRVKSAIGAVGKGERNTVQGFNFRGVDAVVNAAAPYLNQEGIVICPEVVEAHHEAAEVGVKKTPMTRVTLLVCYHFYGPAGDTLQSTVYAEALDSGDKAAPKAMSVAYRIALLQTLNLPTTEPDPDSFSYGEPDENPKPKRAKATVTPNVNITPAAWAEKAWAVNAVEDLREVFKEAGSLGALQDMAIHPNSGEKMTVQELLVARGDELSVKKSDSGAKAAAG